MLGIGSSIAYTYDRLSDSSILLDIRPGYNAQQNQQRRYRNIHNRLHCRICTEGIEKDIQQIEKQSKVISLGQDFLRIVYGLRDIPAGIKQAVFVVSGNNGVS
jgi:hypothetical protein